MSRTSRTSGHRASKLKAHEDITNIPFPEWIDSDVVNEKWDVVKDTKRYLGGRKSISSKKSMESVNYSDTSVYVDTQINILPPSIDVDCWKRLGELYQDVEFVISKQTIDYVALREGCKHILYSEFMRCFLSSIGTLEYISSIRPWDTESVTNNFTPDTENIAWKPWHHIYSHCGAGKGHPHQPQYNPSGKYIVRLHWLGYWRKIYVDDRMPIDKDQNILLPGYQLFHKEIKERDDSGLDKKSMSSKSRKSKLSKLSVTTSENNKEKKKSDKKEVLQMEIWPYILAKALLKIACLTWTNEHEVVDFSPITCLTGWIRQKIDTTDMDKSDVWKICMAYSPKFEWDKSESAQSKATGSEKYNKMSENETSNKDTDETRSVNSKKGKKNKKKVGTDDSIDETRVYCLVGSCKNINNFIKDVDVENMHSEWNQDFLIEESRDIPLIKPEPRPALPRWKRFRWIYWAISKGLWPDDEFALPIRCLRFYNNLKKDEVLALDQEISSENPPSKPDKKVKTSKINTKESKKSSKGKKAGGTLKINPLVDKSVWLDFADIEAHITALHIFFRPSQFISYVKLSNFIKQNIRPEIHSDSKVKKGGVAKTSSELRWTLNIKESRNEPVYLLMDSSDQKFLLINLCQSGHVNRVITPPKPIYEQPYANIVLENYAWHKNKVGQIRLFMTTVGSKSILLYFNPGRLAFKLWIWCNGDYFLTLSSNTLLTVGNVDSIFDGMNAESLILNKFAQEVGIAFGNLVQAFGTPSYMDEIRKFNQIYKLDVLLNKINSKEIYNRFIDMLLKHIESKNETFALRVLFLDPNICFKNMKKATDLHSITYTEDDSSLLSDEDVVEIKAIESAAVKIQSVFKTIYIKKLLERHKQGSKQHNEIYENLKQIYYNIFSDAKRHLCMKILKDFYLNNEIFQSSYLYNDLLKVIDIKSYKGSTLTVYNTWVFITRQKFINKSSEPLIMRAALFSNLPKYVVRIFNNDNGKEVNRITNHAEACYYPPNKRGFTILCYGWTLENVRINWKLYLVFLRKSTPAFHTAEEHLDIKTLIHCYKPNPYGDVCKCKVEIHQTTDVTVRLSTSGTFADLELTIRDCNNKILAKVQGKQNVILPLAKLKYIETEEENFPHLEHHKLSKFKNLNKHKSKDKVEATASIESAVYFVQAKVLNDTWPLTINEWLNVKMERNKHLLYSSISDFLPNRFSKKRVTGVEIVENPFWSLQIIHNIGDNLTVERDLSRENEINEIKKSWYEENPNRYEKSKKIREEYLQELNAEPYKQSKITLTAESDIPLYKWIPETMNQSPLDLTKYYSSDDDEPRYPDIDEWESMLKSKSILELTTLCYTLSQCKERMDKLGSDQIENFVIFREWYDECRKDSKELILSSYKLRDDFINELIESTKNPTKDSNEKKSRNKEKTEKKEKKKKQK